MEAYTQVIQLIQSYDKNNDFALLTPDVYVYSLNLYKKELFQNIQNTQNMIQLTDPKSIYETLINITLLTLNYMHKSTSTSKDTIISSNQQLFERKNQDYGNSFVDYGLIGVLVRLNDKINRLLTLLNPTTTPQVHDERIEDTLNDLYNYGVIALTYKFNPWSPNPNPSRTHLRQINIFYFLLHYKWKPWPKN